MSRFTLLHTAELRLDAPFAGIGHPPPAVAAVLRDASLAAFDALVEAAIGARVAAVLVGGGVCDGLERGVRPQIRLHAGLERLAAHGIRVHVALGRRDPPDGLAAIGAWPRGVTVFRRGAPERVALARDGERLATIHGCSLGPDDDPEAALRAVRRDETPGPHLALLPVPLDRVARAADALRAAEMDAWALGGNGRFVAQRHGAAWVIAPGMLQPRGAAAGADDAHGAALITVEDGTITRVALEPLDRVRLLEVPVDDVADAAALRTRLLDAAAALQARHARPLVLTARLSGRAAALRIARDPDARAGLLAAVRRAMDGVDPPVWWAAIRVAAAPPLPAAADDLAGEVARRRARLAADPERTRRFVQRSFEPLRDTWTATLDPRDVGALLDEAAALAVDALDDGEDGAP